MAEKTTIPLPLPSDEYSFDDQAVTRRLTEQAIQDINADSGNLQTLQQSVISKSVRRHQFLLMGASSV